jgi:hypothetical protein
MTLEHAYRVLCVPREASAKTIKQAYRKLVKRWHPDLYPAGTTEHTEATEMSRTINDAYAVAGHAPLRYARVSPNRTNRPSVPYVERQTEPGNSSERPLPRLDRVEFWARFVCGAVLGLFIALDAGISSLAMDISLKLWLAGLALITVGSGLLAAKLGDKFWYSLMERWFS